MTFAELQKNWSDIRDSLPVEDVLKFRELLSSEDESQVRSSFDLLISFGGCGLCEVLHDVDGQFRVREDVVEHHRLLWERCILEEVMSESSAWHDLYEDDCFLSLEVHVLGNIAWDELSEYHQNKVVEKSLRSVEVSAGSFMMGALPDDKEAYEREKPRHKVVLPHAIEVCIYPVTQGLYGSVMGNNPSKFVGSMRPVDNVSWCDAVLFCNKLSEEEGFAPCYVLPEPFLNDNDWSNKVKWNREGNGYRLPTEAEWEYCARGGEGFKYSGSDDVDEVAWYCDNRDSEAHTVGQKKGNGFGLYDMSGNVFEWCWDTVVAHEWEITGASLYTSETQIHPIPDVRSPYRILRGGCWRYLARYVRASHRFLAHANGRGDYLGFRVLRTVH